MRRRAVAVGIILGAAAIASGLLAILHVGVGEAGSFAVSDLDGCSMPEAGSAVVVCGEVPPGYVMPKPPLVPPPEGMYFVLIPSIVPDEGGQCPPPSKLGEDVVATLCGPSPGRIPFAPFFDQKLCASAEEELAAMKAEMLSTGASPEEVAKSFPAYDPGSCLIYPALDSDAGIVEWKAVDPDLSVPPVQIGSVSQ